ncbi:hypothetical protein [Roseivirga seohaensis]|uniref:hypothetical protein n=1 Tax=Roseivirga seohaensis TaxID=1914963 RepID=UPI003BAD32FE
MTANAQTTDLINTFLESKKALPSLVQGRKHIRHVTLPDGTPAEIRLEIVTDTGLFIDKSILYK